MRSQGSRPVRNSRPSGNKARNSWLQRSFPDFGSSTYAKYACGPKSVQLRVSPKISAPDARLGGGFRPGLFVVFEGLDGCGKTTQATRLVARLQSKGIPTVSVKEPTSGPWGQKIREIALHGRSHVTALEELDYFVRDREEDVRLNIVPALAQGRVVVADRYYYSNIAYQGALGLDPVEIRRRNASFPVPDLVLMLEIPPALSLTRITLLRGHQPDRGYEQQDFLLLVHQGYQSLDDPNIVRLDGTWAVDLIADQVWRLVEPWLTPWLRQ